MRAFGRKLDCEPDPDNPAAQAEPPTHERTESFYGGAEGYAVTDCNQRASGAKPISISTTQIYCAI